MTSIFSSATTLVNASSTSTSASQIHCTFTGSYEKLEPSIKLLNQNGYPSEPINKGKFSFLRPSKSIKVSLPSVAWRVTSMSSKSGIQSSGSKSDPGETLFSSKEHEMIDIRKRSALSKVIEMLIGRRCQEPRFGFDEKIVEQAPKESSNEHGLISVEYQYSTATLILQRRNLSDHEVEMKFDAILNHLDRRGIIWTQAGRRMNPEDVSKDNLEFLVLGAFPRSFISRISSFHPAQSSQSDPLPSDSSDSELKPLIVDSKAIEESLFKADAEQKDSLEGYQVSITREPFRGGLKGFNTPRASGMGQSSHGCVTNSS